MSRDIYIFYNRRPDGKQMQDCVCRAISTALGISYPATDKLLNLVADQYGCEKLYVDCYGHLLSDIFGYKKYFPRSEMTVEQLIENYPDKRLIIRVNGHLTSSIMGTLLDIWDCSNEIVDCYWVVE